ncbi:unnamed protein product [Fraxinus pennsylvanica]|uniref:CUE domain-containing protein n=1 Tax=Fraxinus pennsylvanica TaxID=56036 RepID=A0AAD2DXM6_9LAMI|nr:unnamed protein product [Fraxinus pennsylvanica]
MSRSPLISKKRCYSSATSPVRFSYSPPRSLIDQLKVLFPTMDSELLEKVLKESGNNLDAAIKSLLGLCVGYAEVLDEKRFIEASKNGNLIPLCEIIFSDQLTPVLAYRCLVKEDEREAPSFLFESVKPGYRTTTVGRYSVVGAQPTMEIVAKESKVTVMDHEGGTTIEKFVEDPMMIPRSISEDWRPQLIEELPDAFCGGWVGFFSYDTVRYLEKKRLSFSSAPRDDRNLADIHLGLYDDVIVFDHVEKKVFVLHWVRLNRFSSAEKAYNHGIARLEKLVSRVKDVDPPRLSPGFIDLHNHNFGLTLNKSNMPSQVKGCILVASSPEVLTCIKKKKIVNQPLAGTIKRGKTPLEDEMLEFMMLEKQCAEHVMLVDLGRNDVGKVSKSGSVKVEKLMTVERYSHVMHISSTITAELLNHLSCWDALQATLPVGTVSGAPKVKAMELIDRFEVTRRDANKQQEWVAHIQAGAGIVADSDTHEEQIECQRKAAGLVRAVELAESAFGNEQPAKINNALPVRLSVSQ